MLTVGVKEHLPALAEALAQGVDRRRRHGVLLLELGHRRHRPRPLGLARRAGGGGIYQDARMEEGGSNGYGRASGGPEGRGSRRRIGGGGGGDDEKLTRCGMGGAERGCGASCWGRVGFRNGGVACVLTSGCMTCGVD